MKNYFTKRNIISLISILALILLMLCLIIYPERYIPSTFDGIKLWAVIVLPSLLPFFFLTALLTKTSILTKLTQKLTPITSFLYNTSGISAYVQFMSLLSGYPVGAKIIADLYQNGLIDETEAKKMSAFSSTSGPLFIVGSVGIAMFGSKTIGIILFLSHMLSSVFTGIIFRGKQKHSSFYNVPLNKKADNVLYECVYSSVISVLIVGGFISIFYCLSQILFDFNLLFPLNLALKPLLGSAQSEAFSIGLIECTRGCKMLADSKAIFSVPLSCGLISFGGFSVICQSIIYLSRARVKTSFFILAKLIQMLISIIICLLLCHLVL